MMCESSVLAMRVLRRAVKPGQFKTMCKGDRVMALKQQISL